MANTMLKPTNLFFIFFGVLLLTSLIFALWFEPYQFLAAFLASTTLVSLLSAAAAAVHLFWTMSRARKERWQGSALTALGLSSLAVISMVVSVRHSADQLMLKHAATPLNRPTVDVRDAFDGMLHDNPNFKPLIWPPPMPSTLTNIPAGLFVNTPSLPDGHTPSLADVAKLLADALSKSGYTKFAYFYAPFGFAIVTGIEQIQEDGTPLDNDRRWFAEPAVDFSIAAYLRLLLKAPVGRYRSLIFVVTPHSYPLSDIRLTRYAMSQLLNPGGRQLPDFYENVLFRSPYRADALIYEFEGRAGTDPVLVNPSAIPGILHLKRARILLALETGGAR